MQSLVQDVTESGTRCDKPYKTFGRLEYDWPNFRDRVTEFFELGIRYKINLTKFLSQKNTSFTISLVLLDLVVVHLECLLGFLSSMSLPCQRDVVVINKVT